MGGVEGEGEMWEGSRGLTAERSLYLFKTNIPSLATFIVSNNVFISASCLMCWAISVAKT